MIVTGLTVGLLQENCYILGCETTRRAVIIDPGDNPRAILRAVRDEGLTVERIINTHAHLDHVLAVDAIRRHRRAFLPARRRPAHPARRAAAPGSGSTRKSTPSTTRTNT